MKKLILTLMTISLLIWNTSAHATFVSGSTGALGPFSPTSNTVVALPSDGKLNYTTINIPSGVTVTFTKNASNTPVYMLATGDVTIMGAIDVSGTNANNPSIGRGGPGGFDGGHGGGVAGNGGKGMGPGGGIQGNSIDGRSGGGGFGTNGVSGWGTLYDGAGGLAYGNQRLLPLIGGSGGGGGGGHSSSGSAPGGGGGGAILIASSTSINLNGSITANGGNGGCCPGGGAGGSGGGIKLVANSISGNGSITAIGGAASYQAGRGGQGIVRLEATTNTLIPTNPAYTYGLPTIVFPTNPPALRITSIGGTDVPASPTGAYNQPDILLPSNTPNPVVVNVSADNIPLPNSVNITVIPQIADATAISASTALSGTDQASTASASVTLSTAYANVVTAQATFTVVAMYYNGEEIEKVRVATTLGGASETTYITKSGKEIKAELVAALAAR